MTARYGPVHELPRNGVKNGLFPGVMPPVIFEKRAEKKAQDVNVDACRSAGAIKERRSYLKNEAMVGGMFEFKLGKDRPKGLSRP